MRHCTPTVLHSLRHVRFRYDTLMFPILCIVHAIIKCVTILRCFFVCEVSSQLLLLYCETYDAAMYSNTVCKCIPRLSLQGHHWAYQILALSRWNIKVNILKSYETE